MQHPSPYLKVLCSFLARKEGPSSPFLFSRARERTNERIFLFSFLFFLLSFLLRARAGARVRECARSRARARAKRNARARGKRHIFCVEKYQKCLTFGALCAILPIEARAPAVGTARFCDPCGKSKRMQKRNRKARVRRSAPSRPKPFGGHKKEK